MMKRRSLKTWAGCTVVGLAVAVAVQASPAAAATTGTSPHWFTGKVNLDRQVGSETTYYLMSKISSLFNQSNIFGCTLSSSTLTTCNTSGDTADTDTLDNYDRNEVTQGLGFGSGNGIGQLCGTKPNGPPTLPVDLARSSRALTASEVTACPDAVQTPIAKDGLVGIDFQNEAANLTGAAFGPVAKGWRTGNPIAGPYTGNAVTNIDNTSPAPDGQSESIAYRIWCAPNSDPQKINDWGQLTDPAHPIGGGTPIGVPIIVWGVQTGSGTYGVWNNFVGCADSNANSTAAHVIQENNVPQIRRVALSDQGNNQLLANQEVAQSIYMSSYGVYASTPYARGGANITQIDGLDAGLDTIADGCSPCLASVRTLYNIYRTGTLRASVAGFLNWVNSADTTQHGLDAVTGKNYVTEITNAITTQFGFFRKVAPLIPAGDIASLTS
jgi:ABC-type phosphate transport system substrate-binding protein